MQCRTKGRLKWDSCSTGRTVVTMAGSSQQSYLLLSLCPGPGAPLTSSHKGKREELLPSFPAHTSHNLPKGAEQQAKGLR